MSDSLSAANAVENVCTKSACSCCEGAGNLNLTEPDHDHDHAHDHSHDHAGGVAGDWKARLLIPGILLAVGLVGEDWLTGRIGRAGYAVMMVVAYALCGLPVLKEAWEAIRRKDIFNEFTLMGLASLVALFLGEMTEAVGVMLFYSVGEMLQDKAAGRSRGSIKALLASKPERANLMRDGKIESVSPDAVAIGGTILVKPGEKIPLDGTVVAGSASIDMSSLTGESIPVARKPGEGVYSGTICLDGDLTIQTTSLFKDSTVGRILAMVENAVAKKSKTERFISVFARYYTPAVVFAALLTAVIPPLFFGGLWNTWIYRALVLLVVSCPCALVLSVPLAFFAGIGAVSRHGVLVKGGHVFDALLKAKAVILDKTGTVTEGRPSLAELRPVAGVSEDELLHLSAMAESRSNHPTAKAVMARAGSDLRLPENIAIRDVPGKGIIASTSEGEIAIGNAALFLELGVPVPPDVEVRLVSYVTRDRKYIGALYFEDNLKPEAVEAIRSLKLDAGVESVYMLTGDREEVAKKVSGEIGLDGYRAALLPEGKVEAYDQLSPDGTAVFVGDGVNDAPVLAKAGVGVAMGALGAAAAVEVADAVVLDDSPARLPILFRAAKKVRSVAWQNIVFALVVKLGFIAGGVIGVSGLWEAVFADVGVALLSVLNAMRVTRL